MKRLFALLLCLAMLLPLIPAAAAEDIEILEIEHVGVGAPDDPQDEITVINPEALAEAVPNAKPTITASPESLTIGAGGTATFTVTASGATAYQWYWRENPDENWRKATVSTATSETLVYSNLSSGKSGRQYCCKVSNADGYTYSKVATLTVLANPTITAQPESLTIRVGGTATFTVKADGATAYQWYWRENKDDSWRKATVSTATSGTLVYSNLGADKSGRQYRCRLSNAEGFVYSKTVTLTVTKKPMITSQPESRIAEVGTTVKFTVKADGATEYQWYYRTSNSGSWAKSTAVGATSATLSIVAEAKRDGYQYRCKVSNADGYVYSSAATLTIAEKLTVTTNPLDYYAGVGATVYFKVEAAGAESYQWYYRTSSAGSWKTCSLTGSKTAKLTVKAAEACSGFQYRCKVTNALGSKYSKAATLLVYTERCGQTLTWKLSSSGLLTIGGTGRMIDSTNDWASIRELFRDQIKRVSVGSGVTEIGWDAFSGCSSLTSVTIGSSVTTIGDWAFRGCSSLKSLTIPDNVTSIKECAFYGCSSLKSVTIGSGVTSIGNSVFSGCSSLPSVTIPDNVTSIGSSAFSGCSSLTGVTIGKGVTSIGDGAFSGCDSLTKITVSSVNKFYSSQNGVLFSKTKNRLIRYPANKSGAYTIPDSVTSIDGSAFSGCDSLTSVTIGKGMTGIGPNTFQDCSSLKSVTIPDSVTSIGSYTFSGCSSLKSVTIGNGVMSIGGGAFSGCSSLTSVTIGKGLTSIGYGAFQDCSSLADIYYKGTKTMWNKIEISSYYNDPLLNATIHYNA